MPTVVFREPDGRVRRFDEPAGLTVLDVAHKHGIDLEGACEACMACSTCHVIVEKTWYHRLPPASEDEEDMLDLAFGLTPTSRLGCQIELTDDLDGLEVQLPAESRDVRF